jgi:hypothetical protein
MSGFHSNTEQLITYWRRLGADGQIPTRMAVNPADFADVIHQVFVLGRVSTGIYPIRLVGGFIAELHGRDLRQQNALTLFRNRDRLDLKAALEASRRRPEPVVATVDVLTSGPVLPMEITFVPLAAAPGSPERYLGLYQPLGMVARLRGLPAEEIALRNITGMSPLNQASPRLRLATLDGRRIA